jgi:hypothetical protein
MEASQVVLYFDRTEDALLFTLAASSVIAEEGPQQVTESLVKIAEEIRKASRITTEGVLDRGAAARNSESTAGSIDGRAKRKKDVEAEVA